MLPPMVPRFRTCRSPIPPAASASTGHAERTTSDAATAACVAVAPMRSVSPSREISSSPGIRPRSTSAAGAASLIFIIGRSECPPASGRASAPMSEIASSTLVGR